MKCFANMIHILGQHLMDLMHNINNFEGFFDRLIVEYNNFLVFGNFLCKNVKN